MYEIFFESAQYGESSLYLEGPYFQGCVYLIAEDTWRIFVWHRSQDRYKKSWIIDKLQFCPFEATREEDIWKLSGGKAGDIVISLQPFRWAWRNLETLMLQGHTPTQAAEAMTELATGEGNPIAETNDGLPVGWGMTLVVKEKEKRHYYGLGERTGFLNKKGRIWKNWTTDEFRHRPDADPLYQAHPFVLAMEKGEAFGMYLDETWCSTFDLGYTNPYTSLISTQGPTFDVYMIPGPTPKDVLQRYTQLVGRPFFPPLWALGYHQCRWSYPDQDTIRAIAADYKKYQIPLEAIWLDIDYMDSYKVFSFSPHRFDDPQNLVSTLRREGVRTVVIVDPGVKCEPGYNVYDQGRELDAFVKNRRDEEFHGQAWTGKAVWPDFMRREVRDWWGELHRIFVEAGVDGIWNDMNEPAVFGEKGLTLPPGCKHGKHWHAEVHNLYGYMMSKATYKGLAQLRPTRRPFVLTRSGFAGIQKYAWVWTGDNSSYWEHLEMSIPMLLNLGLSGVPFTGADIGGFSGNCDGELLARWTWLGAFYPFMRNHSGKGSRRQEPWAFGKRYCDYVSEAIQFRYRLLPYLYTLACEACNTGWPLLRPIFLEYPDDSQSYNIHDQFLCGSDLLVAPIIRPGQNCRLTYLPRGQWQDFWDGKSYPGTRWIPSKAPLDRIPLLQRCGSAVPLVHPVFHTKDAWWEQLIWRVALGTQIYGQVYEDNGDGAIEGRFRIIEGSYQDNRLVLKQSGYDDIGRTKVEIVGVSEPSAANVRFAHEGSRLLMEISDKETVVEW